MDVVSGHELEPSRATNGLDLRQKLHESEERFRLIVENAREYAIFTMDLSRMVTSWNSGAERLMGYREAEIIGQSSDIIFTPEDRAANAPEQEIQQALAEGRAEDMRWHQRKDGTRFWGSGFLMVMKNGKKIVGLVKILRDQTETRQAQEELERHRRELRDALEEADRARRKAEKAAQAKDHFLAMISHELRTPLTPVLIALHTLLRHQDMPPHFLDALQMIRRNVELESLFIEDLLDLTRISRGKFELALQPTSLHHAITRAIEISVPDFDAKSQQFTVNLDARNSQVNGDEKRLQQVFWNLLKNASKFTPSEGEIHLRSWSTSSYIEVNISDTGCGIDPETLPSIFEAFRQGDDSIARQFGGLGLGLAISKATIDAHGGTLHASSAGRGKGATFTVDLPLLVSASS